MSESAANVRIEDVLSSIKRLVTEEERGSEARKRPGRPSEAQTRLVLTPALRVAADAEHTAVQEDTSEPFQLSSEFVAPLASDEIRFHKDERPIDPDAPWSDPEVTLHEAAAAVAESREEATDEAEDFDTSAQQVALSEVEDESRSIEASEAEAPASDAKSDDEELDTTESEEVAFEDLSDEELLSSSDEDLEPEALDWNEDVDVAPMEDATEDIERVDDTSADEEEAAAAIPEPVEDVAATAPSEYSEEAPTQPVDMRNATLSQKIQALEAAIAQTEDQWEPDGNAADTDYAARPVKTIPWEDTTAEDEAGAPPSVAEIVETETVTEVEAVAEVEAAAEAEDETAVLDEETLRQLVSDIVREELQGALGERITRNVRKLVRREIHRALTAKDLE
ncbi:MAG: hypothetical protein AB3N13_02770 [Arenibacterium sp.]